MYSARYGEYLVSLLGACIVAFGLGALLADFVGDIAWFLIIIGVCLYGWAMYRTGGGHQP